MQHHTLSCQPDRSKITETFLIDIDIEIARVSRADRRRMVELKEHCIEFKYYADDIHSGLTPPG